MATVKLTLSAAKQYDQLPRTIQALVQRVLGRLVLWPAVSGAKALSGNMAGWYRIRTSDYRLRFRIEGDTVLVDKIGHRRDFYDD